MKNWYDNIPFFGKALNSFFLYFITLSFIAKDGSEFISKYGNNTLGHVAFFEVGVVFAYIISLANPFNELNIITIDMLRYFLDNIGFPIGIPLKVAIGKLFHLLLFSFMVIIAAIIGHLLLMIFSFSKLKFSKTIRAYMYVAGIWLPFYTLVQLIQGYVFKGANLNEMQNYNIAILLIIFYPILAQVMMLISWNAKSHGITKKRAFIPLVASLYGSMFLALPLIIILLNIPHEITSVLSNIL